MIHTPFKSAPVPLSYPDLIFSMNLDTVLEWCYRCSCVEPWFYSWMISSLHLSRTLISTSSPRVSQKWLESASFYSRILFHTSGSLSESQATSLIKNAFSYLLHHYSRSRNNAPVHRRLRIPPKARRRDLSPTVACRSRPALRTGCWSLRLTPSQLSSFPFGDKCTLKIPTWFFRLCTYTGCLAPENLLDLPSSHALQLASTPKCLAHDNIVFVKTAADPKEIQKNSNKWRKAVGKGARYPTDLDVS